MTKIVTKTADQARTRRRWITLAEFVAVAGLLVTAAGLYLNWADRREDRAEKAQEIANASQGKARVTLAGAVQEGGATIALTDPAHTISTAQLRFPAALGVAAQDAMPGPAIRARWIEPALLGLTDKGPDEQAGRLPVLVTIGWWDGDTRRVDTARYDLLWRTHGRVLLGRKVELVGFALADRSGSVPALERAWARQRPGGG